MKYDLDLELRLGRFGCGMAAQYARMPFLEGNSDPEIGVAGNRHKVNKYPSH